MPLFSSIADRGPGAGPAGMGDASGGWKPTGGSQGHKVKAVDKEGHGETGY